VLDVQLISLETRQRCAMVDITDRVEEALRAVGLSSGAAVVYCPHTTAAITINEGADPDVCSDILEHLERMVPEAGPFRHAEGNSDAHIKAALVGASEVCIVDEGRLRLGTWQRVFFCEFDGPRSRRVLVRPLG